MKRAQLNLFLVILASATILSACSRSDPTNAYSPATETQTDYNIERSALKEKISIRMNELKAEVDDLKKSSKNWDDQMKAQWEDIVAKYDQSQARTEAELQEISAATKDQWEAAKSKGNETLNKLEVSARNVKDFIRDTTQKEKETEPSDKE